jgi:hypothetical protein
MIQAPRMAIGGRGWPLEAWAVIAVWTVAMILIASVAYRRDTSRV